MELTAVILAGVELGLDGVLADVTIRHGHNAIAEPAEASSANVTLLELERPFTTDFRVGVPLVLEADGSPRFTGRVTDAGFDQGALSLVAIGMLATYGPMIVPAWTAPIETWSERVARIFDALGIESELVLEHDPAFDPTLTAAAGDGTVTLSETLAPLLDDVGALFCDLPDGRLLVQAVGGRTSTGLVVLDPADVLYAPPWTQVLEVRNVTTVVYGAGLEVTVTDAASVALYDEHPETIETTIEGLAEASTRATERVARAAFPRWAMSSCPLIAPYPLELGRQVRIGELPDDAPYAEWEPIVEGWTDTIVGDEWTMLVALSDPVYSGLVLTWASTPTDIAWEDCNPDTSWLEAINVGALT